MNCTNYNKSPTQIEMKNATFNPVKCNLSMPFRYADQFFVQVSTKFTDIMDYYWISNYGFLYNANTGYYVTANKLPSYYTYALRRTPEAISSGLPVYYVVSAGTLVCTCFVGDKPGEQYKAKYIDGNIENNNYRNLQWVHTGIDGRRERKMKNYWDGNVYSSAAYSEEQVRYICELLDSGITDLGLISHKVFGTDPTPEIYALIRRIRSGIFWTSISSQYDNITITEKRTFTADIIIHAMCSFMKNNPDMAYTADLNTVLIAFGIDPKLLTKEELHRYSGALYQLRYKNAYRRIADQYGIPMQKEDK